MLPIIINILLFILVIGVLTLVHELGHFTVAKLIGATVEEFALGWGPKLFSKEYKGTLYSIRAFPIGGFVKILGDGDPGKKNSTKGDGNLKSKSKFKQALVMLAGVFMNFVFAIAVYYFVIFSSGWKVAIDSSYEDFSPIGATMSRELDGVIEYASVIEDGNAEKAGIPESGEIRKINGEELEFSDEIGELLEKSKGNMSLIEICVEDVCETHPVEVTEEGTIGIMLANNFVVYMDYSEHRVFAGFSHVLNTLNLVSERFGEVFSDARSSGDYSELSNSVSGPVGIYFVLDFFKDFGFVTLISIVADLSISLAIMNLLPIPALDGGRVLILFLESIFRRDLSEKAEALIINISFVLLMVLVVAVLVKDIVSIDNLRSMFG